MSMRTLDRKEYQLGQVVALRYYGNALRGKQKGGYKLATVTKIGRSILYLDEHIKIDMESGMEKSNYTPNYILYDSERHLLETLEVEDMLDKLRDFIGQYGYPNIELNKMRKIMEVLSL